MKAREFLAQKGSETALRNLVKEPLTVEELRAIAKKVGSVRELVAPKRRGEAEAITSDEKLLAWLAADGGRVRRPIIVAGKRTTLGFTAEAREQLEALL
jgi:arsenate reductase